MTNRTILSTVVGIFLLIGCGGGSSDSDTTIIASPPIDPMTLKDAIIITYHYPAEVCESDTLLDELKLNVPDATNFLIRVESNDITCDTYNKTIGITSTGGCATEDMALIDPTMEQYDTSCVVGFDLNVIGITDGIQLSKDIALAMDFALDAQ